MSSECEFEFPWRSCMTHDKGYAIGDSEHPVICDLGLTALRTRLADLEAFVGEVADTEPCSRRSSPYFSKCGTCRSCRARALTTERHGAEKGPTP